MSRPRDGGQSMITKLYLFISDSNFLKNLDINFSLEISFVNSISISANLILAGMTSKVSSYLSKEAVWI